MVISERDKETLIIDSIIELANLLKEERREKAKLVRSDRQKNLYVRRREDGIKQKEIAALLNMHPVTYNLKENGNSEFTLGEAKFLANYFDCTLDDLFGD